MKKVGIIYDGRVGLDRAIVLFNEKFSRKGLEVDFFDVNLVDDEYSEIKDQEEVYLPQMDERIKEKDYVWMNRIYPSDFNKKNINKGANLFSWLSARNQDIINSLTAYSADYDKFFAYQLMKNYEIPTPKTEKICTDNPLDYYAENFSFPLIIKKNTGGKGVGVTKLDSEEKLEKFLRENIEMLSSEDYIVQKYVEPIKNYDVRVGILDGNPLIGYGRSLVGEKGKKPWMGSYNHGSKVLDHKVSDEEKRIAILASKALGADLNEVDIQLTEEGPVVIENNLTPGYSGKGKEKWVDLITDYIAEKYRR